MLKQRQSEILSYINEHGEAKNSDLLALIGGYSAMTLWRDLAKLEKEGKLVRVRGGAAAVRAEGRESSFICRSKENVSAKEELARIASGAIHPNHAYYLDAGSTVAAFVRSLGEGRYTIITSAADIASEMAQRNGCGVTLLGGQVSGDTLSCSGPQAEQMLGGMNIDVAVMSTSGYSPGGGFTSGCLAEARLKRQVIQKAAFTVMLMDCGKLGRSRPFTFAALDDVDVLVGDGGLPADFIEAARTHGVQVFFPGDGLAPEERARLFEELFSEKYR